MLTTTGACNEPDIDSVIAACTINILDAIVPLEIDGTLDATDDVTFRIGRNSAATISAPLAASAPDFTSDGNQVDLTFEAGKNLMRVTDDTVLHYFRVNVVPYWELNDQRLSKDSACRSATARTAAQITDSKCILTTFKGGSFRFHNVINEQFNAYVDVNTVRQVDAPGDTALANPLTVTLEEGENVVRVGLAALGGEPHAEVYDSDAFYYKVTGTTVLVSNLGQTSQTAGITLSSLTATQFTTGNNRLGSISQPEPDG